MSDSQHPWEKLPRNLLDVTTADAPRRLGALLVGSHNGGLWNESVPHKSIPGAHGCAEASKVAFRAWLCSASSREPDPERWADAAVAGALVGVGKLNLDWLCDIPRFQGSEFDTPSAWAHAEWVAQWDARARKWAACWAAKLSATDRWTVVRRVFRADSDGRNERAVVERLVRLYPGSIDGAVVTLAGPKPVADWVTSAVFNMSAPPGIEATWDGDATAEEHRIAVKLWSPQRDATMSTYDEALQAARAILD